VIVDRESFRGIYVIVVTPFTAQLDVDEDALRATLKFCFDAGVHGVVATANASEVGYLNEAERRRSAEIVVAEAAANGTPSVVGVSSPSWKLSVDFARHAAAIGAGAIMAMPPTFHPASPAEIRTFYRELAAATDLPVILQSGVGPGATPMSPSLMAELIEELPTVRLIKEETLHPAQTMGEVAALAGTRLHGVMGGMAGRTLMEEFRHGAAGTMPACEFADIHVALWRALEEGRMAAARDIFRRLLPLLDLERSYGMPLAKEVLRMRGVIPRAEWRQTGCRALDAHARAEVAVLLDDAAELMLPEYRHAPAAA
jgi:dihydrodipicolinate synthase/N-acetylneuraminate lyase